MLDPKKRWLFVLCGLLVLATGILVAMQRGEDVVDIKYECDVCGKQAMTFSSGGDGDHQLCEQHFQEYEARQENWLIGTTTEGIDHEERVIDQITIYGSGLSDDDIREILKVVALHQGISKKVLRIRHEAKDAVEVWTGEVRGPLDGGGDTIRLRKANGAWKIVSGGSWVS